MVIIGSIELGSNIDVSKDGKTSLNKLFALDERRKNFEALEDVTRGAKMKVTIAKIGSFETTVDRTVKKGMKISFFNILKRSDMEREITPSEDIKKGDKLAVTFETI